MTTRVLTQVPMWVYSKLSAKHATDLTKVNEAAHETAKENLTGETDYYMVSPINTDKRIYRANKGGKIGLYKLLAEDDPTSGSFDPASSLFVQCDIQGNELGDEFMAGDEELRFFNK